jgi:hypothetical protein
MKQIMIGNNLRILLKITWRSVRPSACTPLRPKPPERARLELRQHVFSAALLILVALCMTLVSSRVHAQSYYGNPYAEAMAPGPLWSVAPYSGCKPPAGAPMCLQGAARECNSIFVSNACFRGIVPDIPNLQVGYLHNFAQNRNQGFLTLDYMLPVTIGCKDVAFGEAHGEFEDLIGTLKGTNDPNLQMLFGGGYRKRLSNNTMVGVNGFYNSVRLSGRWLSSGILGVETARVTAGNGILMLNFNYYGNIYSDVGLIFLPYKNGQGDYKFEGSYSQPILGQALDLRIKGSGYKLDRSGAIYGWNAGADVTTRSGLLNIRYEVGNDKLNETYHLAGISLTVGFQPERLLSGKSPFSIL